MSVDSAENDMPPAGGHAMFSNGAENTISLPVEILDNIIFYLGVPNNPSGPRELAKEWRSLQLAPYSVVSRQWQAVVERHIWRKIVLRRRDSVKDFEALMTDETSCHRAKYIRQILWDPALQGETQDHRREYEAEERSMVKTHDEWRTFYQRKWLEPLQKLFKILCSWDENHPGIQLSIASGREEYYRYGPYHELLDDPRTLTIDQFFKLEGRLMPYLMRLTEDALDGFPRPSCVTTLVLHDFITSTVRPETFVMLSQCLPRVREVRFGEGTAIPQGILVALREQRQGATKYLPMLPEFVESLVYQVPFIREFADNPFINAVDYSTTAGLDDFSIALRGLSMRLRSLVLSGVRINSSLFWPSPEENNPIEPYWPKLEELRVYNMPPFKTDGEWMLDNDLSQSPNTEHDLSDIGFWDYAERGFAPRQIAQSHEFDKILQAMGQAARNMPQLRYMHFALPVPDETDEPDLEAPGALYFWRNETSGRCCLNIAPNWGYHIGDEVLSAWGVPSSFAKEFRLFGRAAFGHWPVDP
ncbi:uncharacterized protein DSM5745_03163 [Aspergillus mulundensis]|uniref:Uncharacterized protein n=1 Tax=Aspergillus mulundensis TaxID=1810919 RepID=A0A3D8SK18_9EURO|nr:hypothetical protein DSM5745_03163 [Aspergillus mulundensis]RDW86521.1 hypothetical protein DSM5745_03163 [Aspergillus mulundensis]